MNRYAVINASYVVVNIIKWDGVSQWSPPQNHTAIYGPTACIGDIYDPIKKTFYSQGSK
jgi:hypothetical protein